MGFAIILQSVCVCVEGGGYDRFSKIKGRVKISLTNKKIDHLDCINVVYYLLVFIFTVKPFTVKPAQCTDTTSTVIVLADFHRTFSIFFIIKNKIRVFLKYLGFFFLVNIHLVI